MSRASDRALTGAAAQDCDVAPAAKGPAPAAPPKAFWARLGPGLVTGAADDDPSGIATYSQVGAQFGTGLLWTVLFTLPLMAGIQIISATIGRVTGRGLAGNIRAHYPPELLHGIVGLLLLANTINIAADIGAMGAAVALLVGGHAHLYALALGLLSAVLQVWVPFARYAPLLKALTMALLAYVATVFVVHVPWGEVARATVLPPLQWRAEYGLALVAVLGTTISPYLFFWQASQEVEEHCAGAGELPLVRAPRQGKAQLARIRLDTWVGMAFSNLVAYCIMLTALVTLHAHGITQVQDSAQVAQALRPVAGDFAFALFAAGIVGTGLLAVPVLAGSAAYAVAEALRWRSGLSLQLGQARGFYGIIIVATLLGVALNFTPVDPMKALFWAAVVNGVAAVPVMVLVMRMASRTDIMGPFAVRRRRAWLGWAATVAMGAAVLVMLATLGRG